MRGRVVQDRSLRRPVGSSRTIAIPRPQDHDWTFVSLGIMQAKWRTGKTRKLSKETPKQELAQAIKFENAV